MARCKTKLARIENKRARQAGCRKRMEALMKKAHELTVLCNVTICLIFFSRDDNKLVAWPSLEVAKSLLDKYFSLPSPVRNLKALDQESYFRTNIMTLEKKIADTRKVITELEMDRLMFQLQNGRRLADLSQTEAENLLVYTNNKVLSLRKKLGVPTTRVNAPYWGDQISRDMPNVAPKSEVNVLKGLGSGSVYLMDQWFFPDPEDQNLPDDKTHVPKILPFFNLNLKPYGGKDSGESSKATGADDA